MKKLYMNSVTIQLSRTEFAKMHQEPDESVSDFSTRFIHCIKRAYPADSVDPDRMLQRMTEEFLSRLLGPIQ